MEELQSTVVKLSPTLSLKNKFISCGTEDRMGRIAHMSRRQPERARKLPCWDEGKLANTLQNTLYSPK